MPDLQSFAAKSPIHILDYPKLDVKQVGHLRHFHNLVSQADGEWNHFGSLEGQQEWDDAYRYQLATMAYAVGSAHYHRLPALRSPFKTLLRQIIHKMLRREVWGYWYNTSQGGKLLNPDLKELRKPWADPVVNENIMYSGHLLLMTSLYAMLFDDDEFEKPGSIIFKWDPLFWGSGRQDFKYDNRSLQQVILKQMEKNDWVGVCCEPNAVFVVCNQFPIIAVRYNDCRDRTDLVQEVLAKYQAALLKKGMVEAGGLYASYFAIQQGKAMPARQGAHTAWANAFMNAWNSKTVRSLYDKQVVGFLTKINGKTELQATKVALAFRKLVVEDHEDPGRQATLERARSHSAGYASRAFPFETISWGCFTMMLSELGKQKELDDLLDYADTYLSPTWENGGLYYPRNDRLLDEERNLVHMDPHSGNSGVAYSRLNVEDGQKKMWERPWTSKILGKNPWIDGISFADGVDFLRGIWDKDRKAMVITLRRFDKAVQHITLGVRNLPKGQWAVYINGNLKNMKTVAEAETMEISESLGADELDIIISTPEYALMRNHVIQEPFREKGNAVERAHL